MYLLLVINIQYAYFQRHDRGERVWLMKHVKLLYNWPLMMVNLEHSVGQVAKDCCNLTNPHYALKMQKRQIFISQLQWTQYGLPSLHC